MGRFFYVGGKGRSLTKKIEYEICDLSWANIEVTNIYGLSGDWQIITWAAAVTFFSFQNIKGNVFTKYSVSKSNDCNGDFLLLKSVNDKDISNIFGWVSKRDVVINYAFRSDRAAPQNTSNIPSSMRRWNSNIIKDTKINNFESQTKSPFISIPLKIHIKSKIMPTQCSGLRGLKFWICICWEVEWHLCICSESILMGMLLAGSSGKSTNFWPHFSLMEWSLDERPA